MLGPFTLSKAVIVVVGVGIAVVVRVVVVVDVVEMGKTPFVVDVVNVVEVFSMVDIGIGFFTFSIIALLVKL